MRAKEAWFGRKRDGGFGVAEGEKQTPICGASTAASDPKPEVRSTAAFATLRHFTLVLNGSRHDSLARQQWKSGAHANCIAGHYWVDIGCPTMMLARADANRHP